VRAGNGENRTEPVQGANGAQQTNSGLWYQLQTFTLIYVLNVFLCELEKCKVIVLPSQSRLFPNKVTCNLATWESITWDDYQVLDSNQHLIEEGVLSPSDAFFKANFTRLNSDGHFGTCQNSFVG
jgi:hypothetical protein